MTWVSTLDPRVLRMRAEHDLATLLFERLVHLDSSGVPEPMLASRWLVAGDTIVFTIRRDARFHDGTAVRSGDIVRSFSPAITDSVGRRQLRALLLRIDGGRAFLDSGAAVVRGLSTRGDSAVGVRYAAAATPNVADFARPAHVVLAASSTADHPVGSGPWRYVGRALADSEHVLARVTPVRGMPDTLRYRAIGLADVGDAIATGQVDCVPLLVSPTARRLLIARTDLSVQENGPASVSLILLSPYGTRWRSATARRGLAHAIDRDQFLSVAALRSAVSTSGLLRPGGLTTRAAAPALVHAPLRARAMLDSAGIAAGDTVRILVNAGSPADTTLGLAGLVRASLLGVGRVPQFVISSNALADLAVGRGDLFAGTYSQPSLTDDPALDLAVPGAASISDVIVPLMHDVAPVIEQLQTASTDRAVRAALRALDTLVVDQQPTIPLWFAQPVSAYHPSVEGCTVSGASLFRHLNLRRTAP